MWSSLGGLFADWYLRNSSIQVSLAYWIASLSVGSFS